MSFRIRREVEPPRWEFGELEITNASASAWVVVVAAPAPGRFTIIANAAIKNAAAAALLRMSSKPALPQT